MTSTQLSKWADGVGHGIVVQAGDADDLAAAKPGRGGADNFIGPQDRERATDRSRPASASKSVSTRPVDAPAVAA